MGGHKAWEHKILTSNAVKKTYSFYLTCCFSGLLLCTLERSLGYYLWGTLSRARWSQKIPLVLLEPSERPGLTGSH